MPPPKAAPAKYEILHLVKSEDIQPRLEDLSNILVEAVNEGHSVGFLAPLAPDKARKYWADLATTLSIPDAIYHLFIIQDSLSHQTGSNAVPPVLGTIQVSFPPQETHSHRAEVHKLLVRQSCRNQGAGRLLMNCVEDFAREQGKELITLATLTCGMAREIYLARGWKEYGICEGYAQAPDGRRSDDSFFSLELIGRGPKGKLPRTNM